MSDFVMLVAPSANRVYAEAAPRLAAAELALTTGLEVAVTTIAGVDYLAFTADRGDELLATIGRQSTAMALFQREGELLRPVEMPQVDHFDDDFVTIAKYQGKTNELFTRLLLNVSAAAYRGKNTSRLSVLDPLAGRGTTLATAWTLGYDAFGVEGDTKSVEQLAAYWKTYLRRKRIKHSADTNPVRRDGKSIGKKFSAEATSPVSGERFTVGVFTGDTRDSASLWGKKKFDLIVTDAPYGVVHGSHSDVRGTFGPKGRDRSPAGLLREAVPVWASQLRPGGVLTIAWNTFGLAREDLAALVGEAGLEVCDAGPWLRFGHRVDSSIHRDVLVAVSPTA